MGAGSRTANKENHHGEHGVRLQIGSPSAFKSETVSGLRRNSHPGGSLARQRDEIRKWKTPVRELHSQ
jgi:hypothetical protein